MHSWMNGVDLGVTCVLIVAWLVLIALVGSAATFISRPPQLP